MLGDVHKHGAKLMRWPHGSEGSSIPSLCSNQQSMKEVASFEALRRKANFALYSKKPQPFLSPRMRAQNLQEWIFLQRWYCLNPRLLLQPQATNTRLRVLRASNRGPKQKGNSQLQQWEVRLSCWLCWERDLAACKVSALGSNLCFLNTPLDRSGSVWGRAKVCRALLGDGGEEENIPAHSGWGRGQNYAIGRRWAKAVCSAPAAERQKTAVPSPKVRSEAPPVSRSVPRVGPGSKIPRAPGCREGCGEGSAPLFVFRSEDPLGRTHPEKGGAASERRWGPAERDTPERGSRGG